MAKVEGRRVVVEGQESYDGTLITTGPVPLTVEFKLSAGVGFQVEYESKTVGVKRKARVYTPPGYTKEKSYPVRGTMA